LVGMMRKQNPIKLNKNFRCTSTGGQAKNTTNRIPQ